MQRHENVALKLEIMQGLQDINAHSVILLRTCVNGWNGFSTLALFLSISSMTTSLCALWGRRAWLLLVLWCILISSFVCSFASIVLQVLKPLAFNMAHKTKWAFKFVGKKPLYYGGVWRGDFSLSSSVCKAFKPDFCKLWWKFIKDNDNCNKVILHIIYN